MKETDVDCMKYRKSTHIASVDVEAIIAEKGKCELTIKLAYYEKQVNVSGNKTDGYFLEFQQPGIKNMVVNSGNRKKIAAIVKENKDMTSVESRNVKNWAGTKIQLDVDPTVKMMGEVVGGIVVKPLPAAPKKQLADALLAFDSVNDRSGFELAMRDNKEFMQNPTVIAKCKELAITYPNPETN